MCDTLKHANIEPMWNLTNKVVLITGAGNGIGRATARLFAHEGAKVAIIDVEEEAARETASLVAREGGTALTCLCDVSRAAEVERMVAEVVASFGTIDVLHSNAAVQISKSAVETSEVEWERVHSVNLKGAFLCCQHVIPIMRKQRTGSVIITSSGHAFATYPNCSAYAATKGGQLAFMRGVALDYARDGIRVNCVIPGATETRLLTRYIDSEPDPAAARERLLDNIPMRRFATPEDIARAVLFLASDYASYITGAFLAVDGGLLAQA